MDGYISMYERISEEEYEEAKDSSFSYFPVIVKGGDMDNEGNPIDAISYAKHKYIYGQEMMDYLATNGCPDS